LQQFVSVVALSLSCCEARATEAPRGKLIHDPFAVMSSASMGLHEGEEVGNGINVYEGKKTVIEMDHHHGVAMVASTPVQLTAIDSQPGLASLETTDSGNLLNGLEPDEEDKEPASFIAIVRSPTRAPPSVDVRAAATMMAADALHRTTQIYYQEETGEVLSVWDEDVFATEWACYLRSKNMTNMLGLSSWSLIALTGLQHWWHPSSAEDIFITLFEVVILLLYVGIFGINIYFMWGKQEQWHRANHPRMTMGLGLFLVFNASALIAAKIGGAYETVETIHGPIYKSPIDCIGPAPAPTTPSLPCLLTHRVAPDDRCVLNRRASLAGVLPDLLQPRAPELCPERGPSHLDALPHVRNDRLELHSPLLCDLRSRLLQRGRQHTG